MGSLTILISLLVITTPGLNIANGLQSQYNRVRPGSNQNQQVPPVVVNTRSINDQSTLETATTPRGSEQQAEKINCQDKLCYSLPMGCDGQSCRVWLTSKLQSQSNLNRPISESKDIVFELIGRSSPNGDSYSAVGFSPSGHMEGLVSECLQYRDPQSGARITKLAHSFNLGGPINVPVTIFHGIRVIQETTEDELFRCRWISSAGVEFEYQDLKGNMVTRREDLAFKQYFILLATGDLNVDEGVTTKLQHKWRESSSSSVSLSQTLGQIKSSGSHILIRIHGSMLVVIWAGLVTISIIVARYYKNAWSNSKLNNLAIWFVVHRTFMTTSWFGTIIAIMFAYLYVEGYHPGVHQICGTACLVLSTLQVLAGLARPSLESDKRVYFNWAHFICGNLTHTLAVVCLITASFLQPAHLPTIYLWVIIAFIGAYVVTHITLTIHQYMMHTTSKISITPMRNVSSNESSTNTYRSGGDSPSPYLTEPSGSFRQFILGIFATLTIAFLVVLIVLINNRFA